MIQGSIMKNKNKKIATKKDVAEHFAYEKLVPILIMSVYSIMNDIQDQGIEEEDVARVMNIREEDIPEEIRLILTDALDLFDKERVELSDQIAQYVVDVIIMHIEENNKDHKDLDSEVWISPRESRIES